MSNPADRRDNLDEARSLPYRVLGVAAAVAFVLGSSTEAGYAARSNLDWTLFAGMVIGFLAVSLSTFKPRVTVAELEDGWFSVLLFGIIWQAVHSYEQNLSFEVALSTFVTLAVACATLRRREQLRMFLGLCLLEVACVSIMLPSPEVNADTFLVQVFTYSGFMYLIMSSGISGRARQARILNLDRPE